MEIEHVWVSDFGVIRLGDDASRRMAALKLRKRVAVVDRRYRNAEARAADHRRISTTLNKLALRTYMRGEL